MHNHSLKIIKIITKIVESYEVNIFACFIDLPANSRFRSRNSNGSDPVMKQTALL